MVRSGRLVLLAALSLAGCATARLHSPLELADVAIACEVPPTALAQEPEVKKLLFLFIEGPTSEQIRCLKRWARKSHMRLAYIEVVERTQP